MTMMLEKKDDIITIINNQFAIQKLTILNFTKLFQDVIIEIEIVSDLFGFKVLRFEEVSAINIPAEAYCCSEKSSLIIEDFSTSQWENVNYKVAVFEDTLTFNCKNIMLG